MSNNHHTHHHAPALSSSFEYTKLALVLSTVAVLAWVSSRGLSSMDFMRWFMGWLFVVFASFKLFDVKMFATMFASYDVVAKRSKIYAHSYPFIELSLGILYMLGVYMLAVNAVTFLIMGIGAYGVAKQLGGPNRIQCACLGNVIKLPLTTVSLTEDVLMAGMALVMFVSLI